MLRKTLLTCGIISSLSYVAMCVIAASRLQGYSSFYQTVSELSAIGASTRPSWVNMAVLYNILFAAFAVGVTLSAGGNRNLRVTGILLIAYGITGFAWPPMHQRQVLAAGGKTLTDTMHLIFTIITVTLMVTAIGFGAAALGKRFRLYSIITITVLLFFGSLTGSQAANVEANLPTPWIGVWERVNIGAFLLWVIILSALLLKQPGKSSVYFTRPAQ
ncbi:MAG TPA: DUF998 domain-containing protein [Chitinophagaceae bacterium]|nr:DUF998 domain-containing protein [Chitinophagaceae bacterium]